MKKVLLIVVLFLGVFSFAQAQRGTGQRPSQTAGARAQMSPAERIENQVKQMKERLVLTDDQTVKVKDILTKYSENQRAAFKKAKESGQEVDREKMREEMKATMEKQNGEIKALLTAEQKAKYEAMMKEREERMKNGQKGKGQKN